MDDFANGGALTRENRQQVKHQKDGEATPHLTIDTEVVPRNFHGELGSERDSSTSVNERDPLRVMHNGHSSIHNPDPGQLDAHHRTRAVSNLEKSQYSSGTGIRIPQRHPSLMSGSTLTPPYTFSPGAVQTDHPYSTSAHLFPSGSPSNDLPDTPQSNINSILDTQRHPKPIRSSMGSQTSKSAYPHPRQRSDAFTRSLSYSYGVHARQPTFIDSSSYESVPDSPAKLWLQVFADKTAPMPAPDDEGQEIGPYIIGRQIGVGGFSVVKEAIAIDNAKQVHAVKIVRKQATTDEWGNESLQSHFEHEINVWKCLSNRYILPLLTVIDTSYATWAVTLLFTGGTLFDAFKGHRQGLPPMMALKYAYQLASALRYLHQDARVVHRDVKLENCVLDAPMAEDGNLRLCDFGLADFLPGDDTPSPRQRYVTPNSVGESKQFIRPEDMIAGGSLAYAAPEQIDSIVPLLDTAIDMWSYGVVVHALTVGELPFSDPFPPKLQLMITEGKWNVERFSGRVDSEVCEVVTSCLKMNPDKRWTAVDVLGSQWVSLYHETDG